MSELRTSGATKTAWMYSRPSQLIVDGLLIAISMATAYSIRFVDLPEFEPGDLKFHTKQMLLLTPYVVGVRLFCNYLFGVNRIIWRYVGLADVRVFLTAVAIPSFFFLLFRLLLPASYQYLRIPISVIVLEAFLTFLLLLGARVLRRIQYEREEAASHQAHKGEAKPVLLIGAGRAGVIFAREIQSRRDLNLSPVGFVDDDPAKLNHVVQGIPVLGVCDDIPELARKYRVSEAIITIASLSSESMKRIMTRCKEAGVHTRIVPGIFSLVDGRMKISRVREVQPDDLLGREPVQLDMESMARSFQGKRVLVTGAGGSIGSEMCRQVCRFEPSVLVLVEQAENNLFHIDSELRDEFPHIPVVPCVADICDSERLRAIMGEYRPDVVIHAAAHKHVPMMEANPGEALKNNVFGTQKVADIACQSGVGKFVMVSTDKAVNPTSIMGASKRLAELYLQSISGQGTTRFITVRFGNVLGSMGSVIPTFQKQIARGGPVTVTHPDMVRYFMTISEATQLVLQAAAIGQGGEIFILDMGKPMKIVTLAEDLIRFCGLEPHKDIEIRFTGMRPGEKLFEELAVDGENIEKTIHPKIFIGRFAILDRQKVEEGFAVLKKLTNGATRDQVREAIKALVPEERFEMAGLSTQSGENTAVRPLNAAADALGAPVPHSN
ncbi:MAG: UDP-N-acetyl-alpha-D-glucosamine C6 dehydratase [Myxococcota bacterium]|nr:UDP-N-acetyl-alpha-D-glucosamine C6 dehydratase [Myxococcota bacterium]